MHPQYSSAADNATRFTFDAILNAGAVVFMAVLMFCLFLVTYILNRQIIASEIVFYDGLICVFVVAIVLGLIWIVLVGRAQRAGVTPSQTLWRMPQAIILYLLIGYAFVITVPALLDRSISYFILNSVSANGARGATKEEISKLFYEDYVIAQDAVGKRLHEQIVSGNVTRKDDHYVATARGRMIYTIHQSLIHVFNTDPRHLIPMKKFNMN